MTKKTVRQHYEENCAKNGYEYSGEGMYEFMRYLNTVAEVERYEHRWYYEVHDIKNVVIDGVERFFSVQYQECTGDGEVDNTYNIEKDGNYTEMYPNQVLTTVYLTTEQE